MPEEHHDKFPQPPCSTKMVDLQKRHQKNVQLPGKILSCLDMICPGQTNNSYRKVLDMDFARCWQKNGISSGEIIMAMGQRNR
jgi:hypothetical protein